MAITATYIDADTFTVATNRTTEFAVGRRVKCNCGTDGYKYGTILSSAYTSLTTVDLSSGSDNLTSNLVDVEYGVVFTSIPEHDHTEAEGEGGYVQPRDNILINQDFSIWQENTTFTNPANAVYTADGYYTYSAAGGGTLPTINVKKNTANEETSFKQCMELEITNVGVSGATRKWSQIQKVEDFENYKGKTVTFSIRVKSSVAITLPGCNINVYDGISSSNAAVSVTTSWTTFSCTRTISSSATLLTLYFLVSDSAGTISTTGSIYVQYMKVELGSVATPLIPRKVGNELRLCQRYYQKSYAQGTFAGNTTYLGAEAFYLDNMNSASGFIVRRSVRLPVVMKAAPTVTVYSPVSGTSGQVYMPGGDRAGTVHYIGDAGFTVYGTETGTSAGRNIYFQYTAVSRV